MIVRSVQVKGFRSILDETLLCENLTALVGANGTGKSTFLRAIELFYSSSHKLTEDDFYDRDISQAITIQITFTDLSAKAHEHFRKYVEQDDLVVEKVFTWESGKASARYYGSTLQNPEFSDVRKGFETRDRGATAKAAYALLRSQQRYANLPQYTNAPEVQASLQKWEAGNAHACTRQRDDGQFFGFSEVAEGYLGRYSRFLFVPAVRDASEDAAESRGAVITELMDLVVRSVIARKEELKVLREQTQQAYEALMNPANLPELATLSEQMSSTLTDYVVNSAITLSWLPLGEIDLPAVRAEVKLIEDGYESPVALAGHGLQRAFILTMLQHLARAQTGVEDARTTDDGIDANAARPTMPNLVLAIEEPEVYQHPNRQRHIAQVLLRLANGKTPGVAERTQVLYATHSPLFVGIDRVNQIRLLRKRHNQDGKPKITKVCSTSLDASAEALRVINAGNEDTYTGQRLLYRLHSVMTPWMNEGFFAKAVVLVEGDDDRAAILGVASSMDIDLESIDVAVIPCSGKRNIDRPAVIFQKMGIPVYTVWDGDSGQGQTVGACTECGRKFDKKPDPTENHALLRLVGRDPEDWPQYVEPRFACFKVDLETTLREEIGTDRFEKCLKCCMKGTGIAKQRHAVKNASIMGTIVRGAALHECTSSTLQAIIKHIVDLVGQSVPGQRSDRPMPQRP